MKTIASQCILSSSEGASKVALTWCDFSPHVRRKESYEELEGDYFDRQQNKVQCVRLVKQLEALGMKITVEAWPAIA